MEKEKQMERKDGRKDRKGKEMRGEERKRGREGRKGRGVALKAFLGVTGEAQGALGPRTEGLSRLPLLKPELAESAHKSQPQSGVGSLLPKPFLKKRLMLKFRGASGRQTDVGVHQGEQQEAVRPGRWQHRL